MKHHPDKQSSFPVGKVNLLTMYPLTFLEFLRANGKDLMAEAIEDLKFEILSSLKGQITDELKRYYFIGGMPEAVQSFVLNNDYHEVLEIQKEILTAYDQDFSKHAPQTILVKICQIWRTLPAQFARENHKFMYSIVRKGARAKDYEEALYWLMDAGLISQVHRISKPGYPLSGYESLDDFKVYLCDTGNQHSLKWLYKLIHLSYY